MYIQTFSYLDRFNKDSDHFRIIYGNNEGKLYLTGFETATLKPGTRPIQNTAFMGTTSIPSSIVYIDNDYFFVGSKFGQPVLLKILE
jgi:hypothetical protein